MNTPRLLPYLLLLPGIALLLATLYPFLSGVYWIMLAIIPEFIIAVFALRYMIRGLTAGTVKG
jgi:hypothetical protein